MTSTEFKTLLIDLNACSEAREWAQGKSLKEVWQTCERGDWMLWLCRRMMDKPGWCNLRELTLAKARCAKLVIHLMRDDRSKKAVEVAEQFGLGSATREELTAAAYAAAYAADAAAYAAAYAYADADAAAADAADAAAAYAAAYAYADAADAAAADAAYQQKRMEVLKQCADICREILPVPIIN